jgi:hypothetical protein
MLDEYLFREIEGSQLEETPDDFEDVQVENVVHLYLDANCSYYRGVIIAIRCTKRVLGLAWLSIERRLQLADRVDLQVLVDQLLNAFAEVGELIDDV